MKGIDHAPVTSPIVEFVEHREEVIKYIRKGLIHEGATKMEASTAVSQIYFWESNIVENLYKCINSGFDVIVSIVTHDFNGLSSRDPHFVPKSIQFENMDFCDDCGTLEDKSNLYPYKYEPGYKLCEGCLDDRMEEDE